MTWRLVAGMYELVLVTCANHGMSAAVKKDMCTRPDRADRHHQAAASSSRRHAHFTALPNITGILACQEHTQAKQVAERGSMTRLTPDALC